MEPMIALPFHPSNAFTIQEFKANLDELLHQVDEDTVRQLELKNRPASLREKIVDGQFRVDQGVIAGCSGGTYQNLVRAAQILDGHAIGSGAFWLSCLSRLHARQSGADPEGLYRRPDGRRCLHPLLLLRPLLRRGRRARQRGLLHPPLHPQLPQPGGVQARRRPGVLRGPDGRPLHRRHRPQRRRAHRRRRAARSPRPTLPRSPIAYDDTPYKARVYFGVGQPQPEPELVFGPNIADWPEQVALPENLLLTVCSAIYDPVTTTDELIPSGETSSYRSNPVKLSEFALSRKDPQYVPRAKEVLAVERLRRTNPVIPGWGRPCWAMTGGPPAWAPLSWPSSPATAPPGSRPPPASGCWAARPTWPRSTPPSATAPTWSTGACCPLCAEDVKDWNLQPGDRIYLPGIRAAAGRRGRRR